MDAIELLFQVKRQNDDLSKLLAGLKPMLAEISRELRMGPTRDYTTREVAEMMGRSEFTVREWCRLKRVGAKKLSTRSGPNNKWVIPHSDYMRLCSEGLMPIRKP